MRTPLIASICFILGLGVMYCGTTMSELHVGGYGVALELDFEQRHRDLEIDITLPMEPQGVETYNRAANNTRIHLTDDTTVVYELLPNMPWVYIDSSRKTILIPFNYRLADE